MVESKIPDESDWHGTWYERFITFMTTGQFGGDLGLDGGAAYEQFAGKSRAEGLELFRADGLSRIHDLYWMPWRCFRFYLDACLDYLESDPTPIDPLEKDALIWILEIRHGEFRSDDTKLKHRIANWLVVDAREREVDRVMESTSTVVLRAQKLANLFLK